MIKEYIASAKTVAMAAELGAKELGTDISKVEYEILEEPKSGFLGIGAADAKVRVFLKETPTLKAVEFVETLLKNMGVEATVEITEETEEGVSLSVNGDSLGVLIGRHGDVLDSLQYLATLVANKDIEDFFRVTVDVEGYRAKREETLRALARRMAQKVLKYKKGFYFEPMNAYERHIIHSEVQKIEGVGTYSVGDGAERKIIITLDSKIKKKPEQH